MNNIIANIKFIKAGNILAIVLLLLYFLALLLCKYVILGNAHKSLQRILKSPMKASVSNHHKSACHGFISVLCIEALNSKPSKVINNSVSSCS